MSPFCPEPSNGFLFHSGVKAIFTLAHKLYFDLCFPPSLSSDLISSYPPLWPLHSSYSCLRAVSPTCKPTWASESLLLLPGTSSPDMGSLFLLFTRISSEMSSNQRGLPWHPKLNSILPLPFILLSFLCFIFLHISSYHILICLLSLSMNVK